MPRVVRSAEAAWEGNLARGAGRLVGASGAFAALPFRSATRIGSPDGDTSPEELLAAAHAGCFAMSLAGELSRRGAPPGRLTVNAAVTLDEVPGKGHQIVRSALSAVASAAGLTEELLAEAARAADEGCPFSELVRGIGEVTVEARLV